MLIDQTRLPIRDGGRKLFVICALLATCVIQATALWNDQGSWWPGIWLGAFAVTAFNKAEKYAKEDDEDDFACWLISYWRRNVVGMWMTFVIDEGGQVTARAGGSSFGPSYMTKTDFLAIALPMGRWGRRKSYPLRAHDAWMDVSRFGGFRIQLLETNAATDMVLVRLTDEIGDVLEMRVEEALAFLRTCPGNYGHSGISIIVRGLVKAVHDQDKPWLRLA